MIYLDNAATTAASEKAIEASYEFIKKNYANPSGSYSFASEARSRINTARKQIAKLINANPEEIFFTAGGSESDNWVLSQAKGHIITSAIEHHAMLNTCKELEKKGMRVTYIKPDHNGVISVRDIEAAICSDTSLISIMMANNELGTIQPIADIAELAHRHNILFHTDAVQAVGHIETDVKKLGADLLSASAHKLRGLKGSGFLYISSQIQAKGYKSFIFGGSQERSMRAGTENVPGIIAFGVAAEEALNNLEANSLYVNGLRTYFEEELLKRIPDCSINSLSAERLPGISNICFKGVMSSSLLIELDMKGVCCSTGSACDAGASDPSHVLRAIGLDNEAALSCIRFSFSELNTIDEIDTVIDYITAVVKRLRTLTGYC